MSCVCKRDCKGSAISIRCEHSFSVFLQTLAGRIAEGLCFFAATSAGSVVLLRADVALCIGTPMN